MRVLYWADLFWPYVGGIETLSATLMPLLRDRGVEFSVLTSHEHLDLPDTDAFHGIPILRLPFRRAIIEGDLPALLAAQRDAREAIRAFQPDVIHLSGVGASALVYPRVAAECSTPLLVSLHQEMLPSQEPGAHSVIDQLLRRADWITAVSDYVLEQACRLAPQIDGRASVVYNCIEEPDVEPGPLDFSCPLLLCLGRTIQQKGFDLAIAAMPSILDRHPHARMRIIGDGDQKTSLEKQAADSDAARAIEFQGWTSPDAVPAAMNSATLVLMPSRFEGFGIVAAEAATMRRPVVAARAGGLTNVVVHGETGLLIEPEDPTGLAGAVCRLLENPAEAEAMGRAGQKRVRRLYSTESVAAGYLALYEKLANKDPANRD